VHGGRIQVSGLIINHYLIFNYHQIYNLSFQKSKPRYL